MRLAIGFARRNIFYFTGRPSAFVKASAVAVGASAVAKAMADGMADRSARQAGGRQIAGDKVVWVLTSLEDSWWDWLETSGARENLPCFSALRLETALPAAVRGPVDFRAFRRLAAIWAAEAIVWLVES